jgi:hypothetical protein
MRKKKSSGVKSDVTSPVQASNKSRQFREGITRVGIITSPIKGKITNAKQWNRWTP